MKTFIGALMVICSLSLPLIVRATSYSLPRAVTADSIALTSGGSPMAGDTAMLELWFKANRTGTATLHFHFPGNIVPLDRGIGEISRDSNILVDSGVAYHFAGYGTNSVWPLHS
jgi:hypothetical protein